MCDTYLKDSVDVDRVGVGEAEKGGVARGFEISDAAHHGGVLDAVE